MKYNAEQVAFMLAEAIDQNREYKSWHVSTQHLMTLVERVVAEEREACAKVCDDMDSLSDYYSLRVELICAQAIRARGNVATNDTSQERVDETTKQRHDTPPQRKPLTDDEITLIIADCASSHQHTDIHLARAIEAAHGIKGEA